MTEHATSTEDTTSTEGTTADENTAVAEATEATSPDTDERDGADETDGQSFDAREYLFKGGLLFFAGLAVVATIGLYTSASAAIDQWVAAEFRPIFRAAFNLVVLLAAGIGISTVVRRLR